MPACISPSLLRAAFLGFGTRPGVRVWVRDGPQGPISMEGAPVLRLGVPGAKGGPLQEMIL